MQNFTIIPDTSISTLLLNVYQRILFFFIEMRFNVLNLWDQRLNWCGMKQLVGFASNHESRHIKAEVKRLCIAITDWFCA